MSTVSCVLSSGRRTDAAPCSDPGPSKPIIASTVCMPASFIADRPFFKGSSFQAALGAARFILKAPFSMGGDDITKFAIVENFLHSRISVLMAEMVGHVDDNRPPSRELT